MIVAPERTQVTLKKKRFALQRKSVALKRACCEEEGEEYCCCCCFCRGTQKVSVIHKSEESRVKICIRI
jgi:hypothetical protein